jgi:hypothetical protein
VFSQARQLAAIFSCGMNGFIKSHYSVNAGLLENFL